MVLKEKGESAKKRRSPATHTPEPFPSFVIRTRMTANQSGGQWPNVLKLSRHGDLRLHGKACLSGWYGATCCG